MPSTTITAASSTLLASSSKPSGQQAADDQDIYDEIEIEDMTFDARLKIYHYPCPCGDRFEISLADLRGAEMDIAVCPSCSLMIRVIYEIEDLEEEEEEKNEKAP